MHGEGQALALREGKTFFHRSAGTGPAKGPVFYRSAGACPPRSLARRGTGPRPTVKGAAQDTVARGPVPRDRCMARGTRSDARVACEGPRPTVKGKRFFP